MINTIFDIDFLNYEFNKERFIVFYKENELFYIKDSYDKFEDVDKMPKYIKDDWWKYESKKLTLELFNKILEKYRIKYSIKENLLGNKLHTDFIEFTDEQKDIIKTIRRELYLNNIF
jgi:hypothetical protein